MLAFDRMPCRRSCGRARAPRSAGFALVTVVWGLGLIVVLGSAALIGARYRSLDTSKALALQRIEFAGDSAVAFTIYTMQVQGAAFWRQPWIRCRLPDGTIMDAAVDREAGKVDLNQASPSVLARLFGALAGAGAGRNLAEAIVAYRTPSRTLFDRDEPSGAYRVGLEPPKRHPFLSILELDQVRGMSPELMRAALPFVTVMSGQAEIDRSAASPLLLQILGLDRPKTDPAVEAAEGASVTIRADVRAADGARIVREVLVSLGGERGYNIAEWRRGTIGSVPGAAQSGAADACAF